MASFPVISINNILESLDGLDFMKDNKMTRKDFTHPEVSRWKSIYACFFETVSGVNLDSVLQRKKLYAEHRPYMDIYEEGSSLHTVGRIMGRLMALCAVHDFTLSDLIMPQDEKRLQFIMSGVVNLLKFNCSRMDWLVELERKNEEKTLQARTIIQANDDIRKQIDALHQARTTEETEAAQLKQTALDTLREMGEKRKKEEELQAEHKTIVTKLSRIESNNEHISLKNLELKKRCESLRCEIITSPAQYQDAMTHLELQKARQADELCEQRERFGDSKRHTEERSGMSELLAEGLMLMNVVDYSCKVLRQCREQSSEQQKVRADAQSRSQRVSKEADEKKADMAKCHEVIAKLKLQCENKLAGLERTKRDYLQMKESGGHVTKENGLEFDRRYEEISREAEKQLDALNREISYYKDMEKLILTKVNEACSELVVDWRNLLEKFGLDPDHERAD